MTRTSNEERARPKPRILRGLGLAMAVASALTAVTPATAADVHILRREVHAAPRGMQGSASLIVHTMPGTTRPVVTASTLLFVPAGRAPRGGWPIVAWAHGSTTPGYQRCAPSLSTDFDGGLTQSGAKSDYGYEIASLVNAGYAVVAPDYEGLGASADAANPGFNSRSIANALLSSMRAARSVDHYLSNQYVTVGHSDGARALIAFDQLASHEIDLHHRGTVALAPFTSIRALIGGLAAKRNAASADGAIQIVALQNFIVGLVTTGLKVEHPEFDERDIMGSDLASLLPHLREMCALPASAAVTDAVKSKGAARFDGFRTDWATAPAVRTFLEKNDPAEMPSLTIRHPMLIIAGSQDDFVPIDPLQRLVKAQQDRGAPVNLIIQQGGNHFSIIRQRQKEVRQFIRQLFAPEA